MWIIMKIIKTFKEYWFYCSNCKATKTLMALSLSPHEIISIIPIANPWKLIPLNSPFHSIDCHAGKPSVRNLLGVHGVEKFVVHYVLLFCRFKNHFQSFYSISFRIKIICCSLSTLQMNVIFTRLKNKSSEKNVVNQVVKMHGIWNFQRVYFCTGSAFFLYLVLVLIHTKINWEKTDKFKILL